MPLATVTWILGFAICFGLFTVIGLLSEKQTELRLALNWLAVQIFSAVWSAPMIALAGVIVVGSFTERHTPGARPQVICGAMATVLTVGVLPLFWAQIQELAWSVPLLAVGLPAFGLVIAYGVLSNLVNLALLPCTAAGGAPPEAAGDLDDGRAPSRQG
jgi:hypothetical protein